MNKKASKIDLSEEIDELKKGTKNHFEFHIKAIRVCLERLSVLRKTVANFESEEAEILFFKDTKQEALHNLVYYSELKSFEMQFPKGSLRTKEKYIQFKLNRLNVFFQNNLAFVQYIEQGLNHLDRFYFTRKFAENFPVSTIISCYRDPEFSTSHDLLLATLQANKKMVEYLEERLQGLKKPLFQRIPKSELKWTSSKSALTELTYALYHGGAINNGNTNIVEIAQALQNTFNFPLGDVYRTYIEIRSRKNGKTKFLDELSTSLISGMDRLEE